MNARKYMMLVVVALMTTITMAQNTAKEINDIKRNESYIYAEATARNVDDAYLAAKKLLANYIIEYVRENNQADMDVETARKFADTSQRLQMNRGQAIRVFVYLKKSDVLTSETKSVQSEVDSPTSSVTKKTAPEPKSQSQPTPKALQKQALSQSQLAPRAGTWQEQVIQDLLNCETLAQGKAMLNRLKAEYRVKRSGYMSACTNPAACYLLVGDAQGALKTVLSPGDGERTNLRTKTVDMLDNYDADTAIWFQLAK